jgi:tRNA pseudouridine38-40 synthase
MRVAYDGARFSGFARNDDVVTVQGQLEATLAKVLRHPVEVACAGRTDRGVHSRGQVVSFDADADHFDAAALQRAVNRILRPVVVVDELAVAPSDFDARLSCTARTYRYHVLNRPVADPLLDHLTWHVREPLDVAAMQLGADQIVGGHDFSAFSKRNKSRPTESFFRRVHRTSWWRDGELVRFEVTANAYTHQMVRSLVGMFVEVGRARRGIDDVAAALASTARDAVPSPAPPRGLVLWEAHYSDESDRAS